MIFEDSQHYLRKHKGSEPYYPLAGVMAAHI